MQQSSDKTKYLAKQMGEVINKLREEKGSLNKFAFENEIDKGNLSRLENGINDPKLSTLWKVAEGLDIPLSELIKKLEQAMPEDWHMIEK